MQRAVIVPEEVHSDLRIRSNGIEITADFPHVPMAKQREILERIEEDLQKQFEDILGYHKEFLFSVSFGESES